MQECWKIIKNIHGKYMKITWKIIEKYIGSELNQMSQIIERQSNSKQETATTVLAHKRIKISVNKWLGCYNYHHTKSINIKVLSY